MDIYGYARLSRATEESTSIARQRQIIEQTVERRGDRLLDVFEDEDISALKRPLRERPGLMKALAAIEEHGSAALMVWRLDRIARNVGEFMQIVDAGVEVVSATEPIDTTTPMGRAMAQVLQVFAELESRTTGLRAAASFSYLRHSGRWTGGNVPYGYRVIPHPDGTGKSLDVEPSEAALIRRVADAVLEGRSLYSIVRELNDEGIKPRRSDHWEASVMRRILLAPSTLGRIGFKGDVIRDERGLPVQAYPPILTPEEQARLRPLVTGNPARPRRRAARLLSGIIRCDACGGKMAVRHATRAVYYGCMKSARGLRCPGSTYVHAERTEEEVERRFLKTFGLFRVTEVVESVPDDPGLIVVEEAIRDTAAALAEPGADVAALAARMADLHAERERLASMPRRRESVLVETDRTFAEEWEAADTDRRRGLLRSAGAEVRVKPAPGARRFAPERLVISFGRV